MTMRGIDVSKWQGVIDWATVFAHGVEFALVKATQGGGEVDAQFARNSAELRRLNFRRGWYHFPDASRDPAAEARKFLSVVGTTDGEVRMLDVEDDPGLDAATHIFGAKDPVGWVAAWCAEVIDQGCPPPLVYLSASKVAEYDWARVVGLNVGLHVADWGNPSPDSGQWPFWAIHQDTNAAHFPGIAAPVDADVFNGDGKAWDKYAGLAGGSSGVPKPKPKPPTPPTTPTVHVVTGGENLTVIGQEYGVTTNQLVTWNVHAYPSLAHNPNMIWPGWRLVVGVSGHQAAPHTVQAGDTLTSIAGDWGVPVAAVKAANPQLGPPHRDFNRIFPGDVVKHP